MKVILDHTRTFQRFEGFGASGAWWAQLVGGRSYRDVISRLLFSKRDGIGLRTYRYNIGAGSADSGRGDIGNPLRRTFSFLDENGEYDFQKDENAVNMMKQAVKDGADEIILFVNSPPEFLTKNHKSHLDRSHVFRTNLSEKNYGAFADYCLDVCEHFVKEGLPVRYLSPINEPFWIWVGGQEGCHYSPRQAGRLMRVFAQKMNGRPLLSGVRLSGVESGDIRWFNKSYTRNLLRYPETRSRLDGVDCHSYFLHFPLPFINNRQAFLKRFRKYMDRRWPGVPVRMSEWCHMQGGRDKTMDSALVMANVMYEDISILGVTSWQHWIAVSEVDFCDGLIYINTDNEDYELTKRYFVTGNFSKYIPYGARRIDVRCGDADLKPLAFDGDDKTVLVIINDTGKEKSVTLPGAALKIVTDAERDLFEEESGKETVLTPRSVTTFILERAESER